MGRLWVVIGGVETGGLLVRQGKGITSVQEPSRLIPHSLVEELARTGTRLHYRLLSGTGPFAGWVSVKVQAKDLLKEWAELDRPIEQGVPSGACFVSEDAADRWVVAAESTDNRAQLREPPWLSRHGLELIANFRDLACARPEAEVLRCSGGRVKRGILFRTGHWSIATQADIRQIREKFGIRTYIDLRNGHGLEACEAPIFDEYPPCPSGRHSETRAWQEGENRRVSCQFTKGFFKNLSEKQQELEDGVTLTSRRRKACLQWYCKIFPLEEKGLVHSLCCAARYILFINHDEVLKAMLVLANAANYPVAFGCMAGKDRTGLFGILVLRVLGVSDEDILGDFMATNDSSAHIRACNHLALCRHLEVIQEKKPKEYKRAVRDENQKPNPAHAFAPTSAGDLLRSSVDENIARFIFHVLDHECGGTVSYLESIDFSTEDIQRLRDLLIEY